MFPDPPPGRPPVGSPKASNPAPAQPLWADRSDRARLVLGSVLAGRYRLVRFIAEGGMGAVYEAQDLELGASVALKTIRPEVAANPQTLDRFKREILLARRVTHPNVCRIFDFGRHHDPQIGEVDFLTMELLDGESLVELLARRGRLTPAEALPIVRQLVAALDAAHQAGVIHRDFKSANVLLVTPETSSGVSGAALRSGSAAPPAGAWRPASADRVVGLPSELRAVVTDFGLARSLDPSVEEENALGSSTATGTVVGTPAYLSPEQVAGGEASPASDLYALGVVLYELVTGRVPFSGSDPLAVLVKRLREDPPPPSTWVPDLPERWETTILRCLRRRPEERFASAQEVLAALDDHASDGTRQGATVASPGRVGAWQPRRLAAALGVAVAVLGLLGLVILRGERGQDQLTAVDRPIPPQVTPGRVLSHPGMLDLYPSLSPDGGQLAFTSGKSGGFEIYLRDLTSGVEQSLTALGDTCLQPAFSPTGQRLAYHCRGTGGIWVQPAGGGPARQVSTFGSRPSWSPDSERLAFQSEPLVDLASNAVSAMPPSTIWVVGLDGAPPRPVTAAGSPSGGHGAPVWTPDGKRLLFVAADRRTSALWSVTVDGGELVRLVDRHTNVYESVVSPDGAFVYYTAQAVSGGFGLYAQALDVAASGRALGDPLLLITEDGVIPRHPTISRNGRELAYAALQQASVLLSVEVDASPASGGPPPQPLTVDDGRRTRPVFAPDGRSMVFEAFRAGTNSDLFVVSTEGGEPRRLTDHPSQDTLASFTPEADRLVFRSDRLGRPALWRLDLTTLEAELFYDPRQEFDWARLSPNGRQLAMNSRAGSSSINVWLADLPNPPRQLTFDSQSIGFPCWSPDGRTLAVEIKRGNDAFLGVVDVATGEVRQLTSRAGQAWPYSFSPDGTKIAIAGFRDGYWNIYWVSVATGEERAVTAHERLDAYVRYPAWSPDGRTLVYEQAETRGELRTVNLVE